MCACGDAISGRAIGRSRSENRSGFPFIAIPINSRAAATSSELNIASGTGPDDSTRSTRGECAPSDKRTEIVRSAAHAIKELHAACADVSGDPTNASAISHGSAPTTFPACTTASIVFFAAASAVSSVPLSNTNEHPESAIADASVWQSVQTIHDRAKMLARSIHAPPSVGRARP